MKECGYCGKRLKTIKVYGVTRPRDPGVKRTRVPFCSVSCRSKWHALTPKPLTASKAKHDAAVAAITVERFYYVDIVAAAWVRGKSASDAKKRVADAFDETDLDIEIEALDVEGEDETDDDARARSFDGL